MAKPIVTTDAVGCREVVDDGVNGFLVPVGSSELLTQKIKELIYNKNLRDTMGKNGRIKILKEFAVDIVVQQYVELYEKSI
jgi:N,N'-diacetylbacillosaminyl-diphospho-undecaprenol alpha-1,3-N-acetylgalactosaminyltransferase